MDSQKRNLCFFSGDITRSGGTERVSTQIMNGLCDAYHISIVSLSEAAGEPFYPLDKRIARTALFESNPSGLRQYFDIIRRLREFVRRNAMEILIDIDTILDAFSVPALKGTGVKLIAWEHFNFYESMGTRTRMPIRRHFTRRADAVVTLTREDQENYTRAFGGKTPIRQIYNPILLPEERKPYEVHSKTIVSVGRLAPQKGFDYLMEAARTVFEKYPDWEWIILGEGRERQRLESLRDQKRLHQVHFPGRVGNVGDYLDHAALFVLTSNNEGFPLALVEAKAHGLPTVSFRCRTGPSELVTDGVNGFLVDCFNTKQMADRICELIGDAEKRISFAENALLDTEKMSQEKVMEEWKTLLSGLSAP